MLLAEGTFELSCLATTEFASEGQMVRYRNCFCWIGWRNLPSLAWRGSWMSSPCIQHLGVEQTYLL